MDMNDWLFRVALILATMSLVCFVFGVVMMCVAISRGVL